MSLEGKATIVIGIKAAGVITENAFVTIDTTAAFPGDLVCKMAGAGDPIHGVNCYAITAAGQTATICIRGYGKLVTLGATPGSVLLGSKVKADSAGLAVLASSTNQSGGTVLAVDTTAGDSIPINIEPLTVAP